MSQAELDKLLELAGVENLGHLKMLQVYQRHINRSTETAQTSDQAVLEDTTTSVSYTSLQFAYVANVLLPA